MNEIFDALRMVDSIYCRVIRINIVNEVNKVNTAKKVEAIYRDHIANGFNRTDVVNKVYGSGRVNNENRIDEMA